jgi:hypothetical protein
MSVAAATPAVIGVARSNVGDLRAPYASPAVYVWGGDELHDQNAVPDSTPMNAKVLSVDSCDRILMVQYRERQHETLMVGLPSRPSGNGGG